MSLAGVERHLNSTALKPVYEVARQNLINQMIKVISQWPCLPPN